MEVRRPEVAAPKVSPPTPIAAERAGEIDGRRGPRLLVRSRWVFASLAAGVLSVFGLWFIKTQTKSQSLPQIHSRAVLPLRDLSPDSGQEYFADGITEELITNLAQTLPLRVVRRTSVMRYKQTSEPEQIGRELGVEGAVVRSGN